MESLKAGIIKTGNLFLSFFLSYGVYVPILKIPAFKDSPF